MQIKSFALLAVASTGAVAQLSIPSDPAFQSILAILATAIPSSVQQLAFASPSVLISQLQSSLSAGNTPSWYAALPTDVKSALPSLFPAATPAQTTPAKTASTSSPVVTETTTETTEVDPTGTGSITNILNSTTISTVRSATLTASETDSEISATASSTGGASYPTAVFGAGVAGALGIIGMLAL